MNEYTFIYWFLLAMLGLPLGMMIGWFHIDFLNNRAKYDLIIIALLLLPVLLVVLLISTILRLPSLVLKKNMTR